MKAIRFAGAGRPLNFETVPDPEPGPGWVVVDIEAAGLCHSDLHIMSGMDLGDLTVKSPVTLGHEGAGVISAVGDGVRGFEVGDRVGIALVTHPMEEALFAPGVGHDGAFAEQELAHVSTLVHIPDNVTFAEAGGGGPPGGGGRPPAPPRGGGAGGGRAGGGGGGGSRGRA
ncbi:alcohol dehydrogenase catalytic domain-containing protein, partial [Streptomyces sp. NPDC058961]|uniref:alcohol dehydrogenase catalytic domain-containing protein n=1 Tax=Streptomyces sp. NPDC058961 TaxID=3346680 RepID=UPI0036BA3335